MKTSFRLVWVFISLFIHSFLVAQEPDSLDHIIELPIKIDKVYNEIRIDSLTLKRNNPAEAKYKVSVLSDVDEKFLQEHFKPDLITHSILKDATDTLVVLVCENLGSSVSKLDFLLTLNEANQLRGYYYDPQNNVIQAVTFYQHEQFTQIEVDSETRPVYFILLNPFFEKVKKPLLGFIKRKELKKFQLILTTGIQNGVSSLKFSADTSQTITSVYYETKISTGFNIKLKAIYSIKKFLIGAYINYERNNYQDKTRIIARKLGNGINLDYSSGGNWPEHQLHFGLISGYDFMLLENIIISPCFNAGIYFYPGGIASFDTELGHQTVKQFKNKFRLGGSLLFKLPINEDFMVASGLVYQSNRFDASNYFGDIEKDSYHSRQEILKLEIGISMKF
jgi:hypothetical protein